MDVSWRDGKPVAAVLSAAIDGTHKIRPPRASKIAQVRAGSADVPLKAGADGVVTLAVKAGQSYQINFR